MALTRDQQKAMFAKMGIGARVELTKKFGIGDVPIGTEGVVKHHQFGRDEPIVKFPQGWFAVQAEKLKVIKASSEFVPQNTRVIEVKGSKEKLLEMIRESNKHFPNFQNISDDGWLTGSIYLDDGEGRTDDAFYRAKISDNKIEVKMNKNDIPAFWRFMYDEILSQATNEVAGAVGIEEP